MSCALALHNAIEKYNVLRKPTDQIKGYFKQHPNLYKAALLANHIFRALSMTALSFYLPHPINLAVCFASSLFYRLTVETNCAYKFALPAFAGSIAFPLAFLMSRPCEPGGITSESTIPAPVPKPSASLPP